MSDLIIYHNGACSKSNGVLQLLTEHNIPYVVRWYMEQPLNAAEIAELVVLLNMPASELVRRSEILYKEKFEGRVIDEQEWPAIIAAHPVLMERPIVQQDRRAIIARPPERIMAFIGL